MHRCIDSRTEFMEKGKTREEKIVERIFPFLKASQNIIDIGCGRGLVTKFLREKGKKVTAVDIKGFKYPRKISDVVIYDGEKLPFPNNSFDIALLITVMHHSPNPLMVFKEAARVGKEIIVVETTFRNMWQKIYTVVIDTIVNIQPKFYKNSYKSDSDWRELFRDNGFKVISSKFYEDNKLFVSFLHVVYYLKR